MPHSHDCPCCARDIEVGAARCPHCGLELTWVNKMEVSGDAEENPFEFVLATFNPIDAALLDSVLTKEGITFQLVGEAFNAVLPTVDPIRLLVLKSDIPAARRIIADLDLSYMLAAQESSAHAPGDSDSGEEPVWILPVELESAPAIEEEEEPEELESPTSPFFHFLSAAAFLLLFMLLVYYLVTSKPVNSHRTLQDRMAGSASHKSPTGN